MNFQVVIPVLISFAISVILGPIIIPFLRKLKMGQTERVEGVQSHLKKAGTPTMGGIIFLIATVVTSLFYVKDYPKVIPVLFLTLGFGIIGFLDDYLKVVLRRSDGLLPWQKFSLQVVVTAVFTYYLVNYTDVNLAMRIPFWSDHYLNLGWLAIPVLFFAVIGTVNGVNFTDGLDGLASSVTLIVAVFFTVVSIGTQSGIEPITCAVVGGLMGFLLFNVYPAKVFMGDTGSLALGGFVAGAAYMMQMPLFILLVGLIYLVEVLSVIIQVTYFKKTHGKRIFKMAPIHHHFELCGWSETRVVAVFSIITAVMCLIALTGNYDIPGGNPSRPGPVSPCNEYGKVKRLDTIEAIGEKDFPAWFDLPCEEAQCTRIADYILKEEPYPLKAVVGFGLNHRICLLYTSPSPRDNV